MKPGYMLIATVLFAGCGDINSSPSVETSTAQFNVKPNQVPPDPFIPAPDLQKLSYDPASRTLKLYELPDKGEWIVRIIGTKAHFKIENRECKISENDNPKEIEIYYFIPGVRPSTGLTLHDVIQAMEAKKK